MHKRKTVSFFNHSSPKISPQFLPMFKTTDNRFQRDQSWLLNTAPVFWNIRRRGGHKYAVVSSVKFMTWLVPPHDSERKQQNHFLDGGFPRTAPCLYAWSSFDGESGLPPVCFSVLALLKITVNPSADAGSLTSHSPNFGSGTPFSPMTFCSEICESNDKKRRLIFSGCRDLRWSEY